MDSSSRELCNTKDNKIALNCQKWLCHEDCWNNSATPAIDTKQSTDNECVGGLKLYAEPIFVNDEITGFVNVGDGTPPKDEEKLNEIR